MNQARALGQDWLSTPISKVYASDLLRAHTTAQQLVAPRPPPLLDITVTPLLREQNFGIAEGKPWSPIGASPKTKATDSKALADGLGEQEVYAEHFTRHDKFPGGESFDDLMERAEAALDLCLWPHLQDAKALADVNASSGVESDGFGYHVVIASHGLCISELVAAVVRRSDTYVAHKGFRGLQNTAWTRLSINILVCPGFCFCHRAIVY